MIIRDSLIKRFEFCYELTWKFIKDYVEKFHDISIASPKKVFNECLKQNLTSLEETETLLNMVDDRNMTTHLYDEASTEEISQRIHHYFKVMNITIQRLKQNIIQ